MFCGNRFGDFQKSLTLGDYEKEKLNLEKQFMPLPAMLY